MWLDRHRGKYQESVCPVHSSLFGTYLYMTAFELYDEQKTIFLSQLLW